MTQTHHAGVTRRGGWGGAAWLIIVAYMFALLLLRFVMRYKSTSLWFLHTGGGGERVAHRGKMQRGRRMSQGVWDTSLSWKRRPRTAASDWGGWNTVWATTAPVQGAAQCYFASRCRFILQVFMLCVMLDVDRGSAVERHKDVGLRLWRNSC